MATNQTIKEVERSGTLITKERLLDLIKKSPNQSFTYSQNPNSKTAVIVLNL